MNLNQITVSSLDVPRAIKFYESLGLKLIVHTHDDYARFECPEGESTFSLHRVDQLPSGSGVVVYFEIENLDEKVRKLQSLGFEFDLLPTDQSWRWREARLRDLDNNELILFWAGEDRRNPPWRLDK